MKRKIIICLIVLLFSFIFLFACNKNELPESVRISENDNYESVSVMLKLHSSVIYSIEDAGNISNLKNMFSELSFEEVNDILFNLEIIYIEFGDKHFYIDENGYVIYFGEGKNYQSKTIIDRQVIINYCTKEAI